MDCAHTIEKCLTLLTKCAIMSKDMCFKTDTKIRKGIDEDSISLKKMTESRCWCESGMSIHWKKIPSKPQPEMTD